MISAADRAAAPSPPAVASAGGRSVRALLALGLILGGLLLDLCLVVLILGEGFAPARLAPGLAAAGALLGGAMLVLGLTLVESRLPRIDFAPR
jgi:hypothetical protein